MFEIPRKKNNIFLHSPFEPIVKGLAWSNLENVILATAVWNITQQKIGVLNESFMLNFGRVKKGKFQVNIYIFFEWRNFI